MESKNNKYGESDFPNRKNNVTLSIIIKQVLLGDRTSDAISSLSLIVLLFDDISVSIPRKSHIFVRIFSGKDRRLNGPTEKKTTPNTDT